MIIMYYFFYKQQLGEHMPHYPILRSTADQDALTLNSRHKGTRVHVFFNCTYFNTVTNEIATSISNTRGRTRSF